MEPPLEFRRTFLIAAIEGNLPLLQSFVEEFENGEGPQQVSYVKLKCPDGCNALHWAAAGGKTDTCRYLIEILKFNVNSLADDGETPLFHAILFGQLETAVFLIESGADVTIRGNSGHTTLHIAVKKGSKEILDLLILKGAIIHLHANSLPGMPLHLAAMIGNHEAVEYLLDLKADPNSTTPTYMSPLLLSTLAQSIKCMELLLKAGAGPNGHCKETPPLCHAVSLPNRLMVSCLLKYGADPNKTDFSGQTPLELAALIPCRETVELLFPLTSPIAGYPDWSIIGFMKHILSEEGTTQRKSKQKKLSLLAKAQGEDAFKTKHYQDAVHWFTQAILADPKDAKVIAHRSLCYAHLNEGECALSDARVCLKLEPKWAKAHYGEGVAWNVLKDYAKAAEAFSRALALDRGNKEFKKAYRAARGERRNGNIIKLDPTAGVGWQRPHIDTWSATLNGH